MYYKLKENNPFYGIKGTLLYTEDYNNLPEKHKILFEKESKPRETHFESIEVDLDELDELEEDNDPIFVINELYRPSTNPHIEEVLARYFKPEEHIDNNPQHER